MVHLIRVFNIIGRVG